ncbi:hypothetical protein KPH14_000966 [Odynerus spinipes]|uniref:Uncharacterized protein n=1 Tax=Odynerus spinipes TaxID=1348599 RepID=A0AAD9VL25_9HYME|nr:hypothetical protein KPH14_000966 [Odynerus spinipes]
MNPKILCTTETHVTDEIKDQEVLIPGYEIYRCNAETRRTGGIIIYVKKSITAKMVINKVLPNNTWILGLKCKQGERTTCCAEPLKKTAVGASIASGSPSTSAAPTAMSTAAPIMTRQPTPTPPPPGSSDATLLSLLAAVNSFGDSLKAFREEQDRRDKEAERRLTGQLSQLRKDLAGKMDSLASDLRSVSLRVQGVETRVETLSTDLNDLSGRHHELSSSFAARSLEADERHKSYSEALRGTEATTSALSAKFEALSNQITRIEGERRASELIIAGLPETPNQDLPACILKAAALVFFNTLRMACTTGSSHLTELCYKTIADVSHRWYTPPDEPFACEPPVVHAAR